MRYKKIRLLLFVLMITILITSCNNGVISDIEGGNGSSNITTEDYLLEIDKSPEDGFHWTYYLYIPEGVDIEEPTRLLVETNNPHRSDDISDFEEAAEMEAKYSHYAHNLNIPILVPAFPNFDTVQPGYDCRHYISLCEVALTTDTEEVKRLDKQLLSMIDDAQNMLKNNSNSELNQIELKEKIFINGDSTSGSFANRFTKIHPNRVRALATGAQDFVLLPFNSLNGENFDYPSGINDLYDYIGEDFDLDAYKEVAKFYTAGALEGTLNEFSGSIGAPEQREAVRNVFGTGLETRWENVENEYERHNIPVQMEIYNATSHEIREEMMSDRLQFFEANLGDERVMDINTHQYAEDDLKGDIEQINQVTIKEAFWAFDSELPDKYIKFVEESQFSKDIIFITDEGFCCETQLADFILRSGFSVNLVPEDTNAETIELKKLDINQGIYRRIDLFDEVNYFHGIFVSPLENEAYFDKSIRYKVKIEQELEEYYNMPSEIYLEPIE